MGVRCELAQAMCATYLRSWDALPILDTRERYQVAVNGSRGATVNARSRQARRTIAQRSATTRAQASIRRNGEASLTTYGISAGLGIKAARSVAGSLRKAAVKLGLTGSQHRVHTARRMRTSSRYTPAQVLLMLRVYRPRLASYKAAATRLTYTLAA